MKINVILALFILITVNCGQIFLRNGIFKLSPYEPTNQSSFEFLGLTEKSKDVLQSLVITFQNSEEIHIIENASASTVYLGPNMLLIFVTGDKINSLCSYETITCSNWKTEMKYDLKLLETLDYFKNEIINVNSLSWTDLTDNSKSQVKIPILTQLRVVFAPHLSYQDISNIVDDMQSHLNNTTVKIFQNSLIVHVETPSLFIKIIEYLENVKEAVFIEPTVNLQLLNEYSSKLIQNAEKKERTIHENNIFGRNQIIGIADSGLDEDNCFFNDDQIPFPINSVNFNHRKVVLYQSLADSSDIINGHGTHVCGTIGGAPSGYETQIHDDSFQDLVGVAPAAKLCFQDIGQGSSIVHPGSLYNLLNDAYITCGSRIHSNSWGSTSIEYNFDSYDVDKFIYDHPDMLVIFAAGNSGRYGYSTVLSPANAKNALAVGATLTTNQGHIEACCPYGEDNVCCSDYLDFVNEPELYSENVVAEYSSRGPTVDLRFKPDVVAAGGPIRSTKSTNPKTVDYVCAYDPLILSGTSMATPSVAGSAALIREYFEKGYYPTGKENSSNSMNLSADILKSILVASCEHVNFRENDQVKLRIPDYNQGFGRINLDNVLGFDEQKIVIFSNSITGSQGYTVELEPISSETEVIVVLTWFDPSGFSGSILAIVNTIDFIATDKNGEIYYPNLFNVTDPINNVQRISFKTDSKFKISVTSRNMITSNQKIALTVRNAVETQNNQTNDNMCPGTPICSNHGTCVNSMCDCNEGYHGANCQYNECLSTDLGVCNNNGECSDDKCNCFDGYLGDNCGFGFCVGDVILNSKSGYISEHSGPENSRYSNNQMCSWTIVGIPGSQIMIKFEKMQVENGFDFVSVFDGHVQSTSSMLGNFTGSTIPDPIFSQGESLTVVFQSDSSIVEEGFLLQYFIITNDCTDQCNRHGACNFGKCICHDGWEGEFCETPSCPAACFGVGDCVDGKCQCYTGYSGIACQNIDCSQTSTLKPLKILFDYYSNTENSKHNDYISPNQFSSSISMKVRTINFGDYLNASLGIIENSKSSLCVKELPSSDMLLATGSTNTSSNEVIPLGFESHDVNFNFHDPIYKFSIEIIVGTNETDFPNVNVIFFDQNYMKINQISTTPSTVLAQCNETLKSYDKIGFVLVNWISDNEKASNVMITVDQNGEHALAFNNLNVGIFCPASSGIFDYDQNLFFKLPSLVVFSLMFILTLLLF
eukprot:TRINITY_DN9623_c0_g1_i1.p1 TRINITY_DN9623_c0_g1~~TRINITY_DN9623_c0_g1_i1.p1  ORF type:complete len:1215 (+),score=310.13 TRINITY_DN9623_c0_g1_i1:118-3762(+)